MQFAMDIQIYCQLRYENKDTKQKHEVDNIYGVTNSYKM